MFVAISKNLSAAIIISLVVPLPASALPAITCHCFTDRSYEPGRPAAADPYFLATTQNSFFAVIFNIDKKSLVMKKQQGTSPDDLWIAYWVASKSGTAPETLLQAKQNNNTWSAVLSSQRLTKNALGARFLNCLNTKSSSVELAHAVVDELFLCNHLLDEKELVAIRLAGASNQELIITALIAARTKQPPRQIYLEVKKGSKTWGSLLTAANIDTKNMQREISAILTLKNLPVSEK